MMFQSSSSPVRGGGPRAERVVEGVQPHAHRVWSAPSTMLRMVPLLVPGRN